MKSFTINMGKNHEVINSESEINGNTDACISGFFAITATIASNKTTYNPSLDIDGEDLKKYFSDVTGLNVTGLNVSIITPRTDGKEYVHIIPAA